MAERKHTSSREEGFEPKGLPGYRVFQDQYTGRWWFRRPAGVPHSFAWDEATQDHTCPIYNDWEEGPRATASGAVAAAHQFDAWVREKMAAIAQGKALA
jgi:hypothetical protein